MYLYNLESNNFNKMIKNNKTVIVGIFETNCIISNLFKGTLNKINEITDKKIIVSLVEKEEYLKISAKNEKQIFPILLVYNNGVNVKKIYGFNNYFSIYSELKKMKLC